jgi:histidyl-tRNA synthetase
VLKAPRGTQDILPPQSSQWIYLESVLRDVCRRYNYHEIRTPVFEQSELFSRTVGEATDIVEKEMYAFKDKTGRDLALRPEMTASVARAFVEHGMASGPLPRKFFYIGTMYRYERPQAGRYREHRQFGVEVLGSDSPYSDVEAIVLAMDAAEELGLTGTELVLNSIGCPTCRAAYRKTLVELLKGKIDELCPDCRSRLERNPLRVLDCKNESCKAVTSGVPGMLDYLCPQCLEHWKEMTRLLGAQGIDFTVDSSLVRGLDYYTRTVFELKWPPLGAQNAILGGGRYDGLVEEIGGQRIPGVGFAMGMERMLMAVQKGLRPIGTDASIDVFVIGMKGADSLASEAAFSLARSFRKSGLSCEFDPLQRSMKAQMKQADKANARFVAIVGDEEAKSRTVAVRSMGEGWQKTVGLDQVVPFVREEVQKLGR